MFPGAKSADDVAAASRQLAHESRELQRAVADKDGTLLHAQAMLSSAQQQLTQLRKEVRVHERMRKRMGVAWGFMGLRLAHMF